MSLARASSILLLLLATMAVAADSPEAIMNGRDEIVLFIKNIGSAPTSYTFSAGAIFVTTSGANVIALRDAAMVLKPGQSAEIATPAAALSSRNLPQPREAAHRTDLVEPRLAPLLTWLGTQKDLPRATSQCAVLAILEDLDFAQWLAFAKAGAPEAAAPPGGPAPASAAVDPLIPALDAILLLRQVAPERNFRLAQDPGLKLAALRHPATRAKAAQYYGLATPANALPGQTPPDLGQLLHTKSGDNCPICRMRAQAESPSNGL